MHLIIMFGEINLRFILNFRKNMPNNTTKLLNIPELLHFFDIFCNSPGVSTVLGPSN